MNGKPEFERLLQPYKVGQMNLKNRIVLTAMSTHFAGEDGEVTDTLINWHARRAKGGAALIIVEPAFVATTVDPLRMFGVALRADDARFIPGLARLAEAIHQNGAKAALQVMAGGGAQAVGEPWIPGVQPQGVSPSGVPGLRNPKVPRVLSIDEIEKIVESCAMSARNIKDAAFDMIEINGHGGYIIAQFLSPYFNKRTDKYGGSLDNRCRFLLEIVDAMRKAVGPDFPLTVKYSIDDFLPGGWEVKQSQVLAQKLAAAGVDGIGVSSGVHGSKMPAVLPYFYPRGVFLPFAKAIKEVVDIPVFVGGRLDDPRVAEKALEEGKTDFIYLGRGLITDPDWPQKVASGQIEEIRPCIACNECRQQLVKLQPVRCTGNAVAGREGEYDLIKPAEVKKKVMIVGAGPAGMEAARIAAPRGHQVILYDKRRRPGGLMVLGGVHNQEIDALLKWMTTQIKKLPVEVRLQTEVTPALVEEMKPDVVILASGGTFVTPKVPGIRRDNVFSGQDFVNLLNGIPLNKGIFFRLLSPLAKYLVTTSRMRRFLGFNFPIKKIVAVIGGQFVGCALTLALANKGKRVTVIEESDQFGSDIEANTMVTLNDEVEKGNVKILTSTKLEEVTDKGVVVTDKNRNKSLHKADTVFLALELGPSNSSLADDLKGKVTEVYTIGDAKSFRRIMEAVSEGYVVAHKL